MFGGAVQKLSAVPYRFRGDALAESMGCTLYARFAVVNRESNNNLRIDNRETSRYDSQL